MSSMAKKCFIMVVICIMLAATVYGCRRKADSMKTADNVNTSGTVAEDVYITTTTTAAYMDVVVETTTNAHKESTEPESTYAVVEPATTTAAEETATATVEPTVAEMPTEIWTTVPVEMSTTEADVEIPTEPDTTIMETTIPMTEESTTPVTAETTTDVSKEAGEKKESGLGYHGALSVRDGKLADSDGDVVILRGISTMGLQWYGQYVSKETFEFLKNTSGMNVIRLAMYTAEGGYCHRDANGKAELESLIDKGVRAAAELDMYVIIDWHILSDGNPNTYKEEAKTFFDKMSKQYADYDNIIYEICNEPNSGANWNDIKNYANEIIPVIRNNDSDAVVLVGTPTWSQEIDKAMADPLKFGNIMYTLHFYADTHKDYLRERLKAALEAKLPVFVSEFGICDASGNGAINEYEAGEWAKLMDEYDVSWCIWNLSNKNEASALIASWCNKLCDWAYDEWSQSGKWFLKVMENYK